MKYESLGMKNVELEMNKRVYATKMISDSTFFMVYVLFFLLLVCLCSCESAPTHYLHIAHTRSYDGNKDQLMPTVKEIDFKAYEVLMLGGDLVFESTGTRATLDSLDSVFDLSNPGVLWTLGNHDYHYHPEWIPAITQRPLTYHYQKNGIMFLVLDSQEAACNTQGQQAQLLERTIKKLDTGISHLMILHHKLLWMKDEGLLETRINAVTNGGAGDCFHCIPPNDFYELVYPRLVEVQKNGVQVICIAGDIGAKVHTFEHQTKEGIYFLASGLKDGSEENKVLLFEHDLEERILTWEFKALDEL